MLTARRRRQLERNITVYYILRILVKRLVWPILTIFLVRNQLSPTEIGTIFAASTIVGLILEVPSGAIADRIGRRNAMALNFLGGAVSMFLFWIGDSFAVFLVAQITYQAAGTLWTGTNEAFLYETLHELNRTDELKRITGRALALSQWFTGALFVFVPILATWSLDVPFLLNCIVLIGGALLARSLIEPARTTSVARAEIGRDFFGFRAFITNRPLFIGALFFASVGGIDGILQDFRQIYLEAIGVDLVYFGFVYLGLRIVTGLAGVAAAGIERRIGPRGVILCIPAVALVAYVALSLVNQWYGVLFLVLDGLEEGLTRPIEQERLQGLIDGRQRATMLSISNLLEGLIRAGVVFIGGIVIDHGGIHAGFALAAALVIIVVGPLTWRFLRMVPARHPAALT
ncbi:MAG: MFS transporter [bacterium]|nr:MFS transporter [bacterium]